MTTIRDIDEQLVNQRAYWRQWGHRHHDRSADPEVAFHITGVPHPTLNGVTHSTAPAGQVLPRLRQHLAGLPFIWQVTEIALPGTIDELLSLDGEDAGVLPVMALDVRRYRPIARPESPLRITQLPAGADLAESVGVFSTPMGLSTEDRRSLTEIDAGRAYSPDALTRFVGVLDGRIVATTELLVTGPVGGLYAVATLEAYRRRGIATAMVDAAIQHAAASGVPVVTLHASDVGVPVYERLGFQEVSQIRLVRFAASTPEEN